MMKDGGQAFPGPIDDPSDARRGMSLRDYFAGQAMEAAMNRKNPIARITDGTVIDTLEKVAVFAYAAADAMLAERENAS